MSKRSPTARVQSQLGPDTTGICSLCHHAFVGTLKVLGKFDVSQFTKFRAASCHCFASCHCCHDPFIVRSAQTRPPFTGFTQRAHPSRCSRPTLTFRLFCTAGFFGLCSCLDCNPVTNSVIGSSSSSCSLVWDPWSVEYQSCKLAVLL